MQSGFPATLLTPLSLNAAVNHLDDAIAAARPDRGWGDQQKAGAAVAVRLTT
jgi:hypothetical protein